MKNAENMEIKSRWCMHAFGAGASVRFRASAWPYLEQ